jgi:hypothetical protein
LQDENFKTDKQLGIEFIQSPRGQYIMAQALHKAIEVMKAAPKREREYSNIADMELCQKVFDFPAVAFNGTQEGAILGTEWFWNNREEASK